MAKFNKSTQAQSKDKIMVFLSLFSLNKIKINMFNQSAKNISHLLNLSRRKKVQSTKIETQRSIIVHKKTIPKVVRRSTECRVERYVYNKDALHKEFDSLLNTLHTNLHTYRQFYSINYFDVYKNIGHRYLKQFY